MEDYMHTICLKSSELLNDDEIERLSALLKYKKGLENFRISSDGVYLEYNAIIPHYCIFETGVHENLTLIFLTLIIFTITVYVTMYICTTFMRLFRDIKRQIDEKNHKLTEMDKQKSQFFLFSSPEY